MQFLAPPLALALESGERFLAGRVTPEELAPAVSRALAFVHEGMQLYRLLSPGILRNGSTTELLRQIELEQSAQLEGLQALQKAASGNKAVGLARLVASLRQASEKLLQLFASLQEAEIADRVYSPFPVVDHFMKVGINHLSGSVDAFEVQSRLATVAGLIGSLTQDVERFQALHEAPELAQPCREPLQAMQAGLGAAASYLNSKKKTELEDGLKLLGSGSVKLAEALQALDAHAGQNLKFSSLRYLEELARSATVGDPWWGVGVNGLVQALAFYENELTLIRRSPLFFEFEPAWTKASQLRSELAGSAEGLLPEAMETWLKQREPAFRSLDEQVRSLRASLNEVLGQFSQAPHIAGMRELIGRTLNQDVSLDSFAAELAEQKSRQSHLMEQLQAADDGLSQELAQLIGSHAMAFSRMELFLQDKDREHLIQAWKLIALTCPRILQLTQQLQSQLAGSRGSGTKMIVCFRCGADNPATTRFCRSCSAAIPQVSQEVTDYTEITSTGNEEVVTIPANLARLERMAQDAENGSISRDELKAEIDDLLKQGDKVRKNFEKQVIGMMGRGDQTFDAYAQFFAIRMGQFVQGMMQMRTFAEGGSLSHLYSGLATCRESGEELQGFQEVIGRALRNP